MADQNDGFDAKYQLIRDCIPRLAEDRREFYERKSFMMSQQEEFQQQRTKLEESQKQIDANIQSVRQETREFKEAQGKEMEFAALSAQIAEAKATLASAKSQIELNGKVIAKLSTTPHKRDKAEEN